MVRRRESLDAMPVEPIRSMTIPVHRIALVLVASLLISGGAGFAVYQYLKTEYQQEAETDIRLELDALQDDMRLEMSGISNVLSFLVDQVEYHLSAHDPETMQRLSYDFLSYVRASHILDQIRLIDMSGQEVIRANYNDGKSTLVPAGELQNKADRYYFQEGLKLARGEVYVSPFDLNVEHGEIEQPIKPTFRLVQPAFDVDGKQVGLVVVNVLGAPLLANIGMRSKLIPVQYVSLLNQDGYWLKGPVPENLWGFMFPNRKERSMAATSPVIWRQIHDSDQVRIRANGGVYLSSTFYPARVFGRGGLRVERPGERFWKLLAYYPDSSVDGALTDQYRLVIISSAGSGVALAIILLAMLRLRRHAKFQRAAEERARQQTMENARSKAIVTIAGGIAHQFNNILTGILGAAYLLRSRVEGQSELCDRIDTIEQLGEKAGDLVRLLMTYAQVDYRESKRLSLNQVIADKAEEIRRSLPAGIRMDVSITDASLFIKADKSKLEKMLEHLFSNAVDAVEDISGAEIRLSLEPAGKEFDPGIEEERRFACLTLADNGCGIAPEDVPNIFDPFFTTKEEGKGTGMGLSLVQGVVQALHGHIEVEENAGGGTVIRIYLQVEGDSDE